jgi:hypothetical protein
VFSKWDLEVESYGLRRQAERDAALDPARHFGVLKSAVAAALCQRSPKASPVLCGCFFLNDAPMFFDPESSWRQARRLSYGGLQV